MNFLITLLTFLLVSGVLCSRQDFYSNFSEISQQEKIKSDNYDISIALKVVDEFISLALDEASAVSDRSKSIFQDSYQSIAYLANVSFDDQKIFFFDAIFEFMKRKSDEILIMPATDKMIKNFIRKVSISVNEINFVKSLENFVFSENCAEHILQAVKKLDPSLKIKDSLSSVLTLAEYCSSDSCQDLIFSLILKYLEKPNNQLPFFNINSQIKETSIIDIFLESCYVLMSSRLDNKKFHNTLIRIIIEGPYSFKSTQILMKLFVESKEMFKSISETKINDGRLALRLMKSDYFDYFLNIYPTTEDETIIELKTALESKKTELETILSVRDPENLSIQEVDADNIMKYAAEFKYDFKILEFYWKIDPEFIKSVTIDLNTKIVRIINEFKNLKSLDEKIIHLFSAYICINLIPGVESFYIPLTQYEPILDFTIELMNSDIKFELPFHLIRNVICLPFVEVTMSGLEKFWHIIHQKFEGNIRFWNISVASIIMAKFKDQKDAFDLFKMVYSFFELRQIDFNTIAALLLIRFRSPFFLDVFYFCKHHKLLHKLQIHTIEESLKFLEK